MPYKLPVRETVDTTYTVWPEHAKNYDFPADIRDRIQKHIDALGITG